MGRLLERGYTIHHGAQLLMYGENVQSRQMIMSWLHALKDGRAWPDTLEVLRLPSDVQAYLYFSERYGKLSNGFYHAGRMLQQREVFKEKIQRLSRYPLFLIWLVATLFIFMTYFVFPQFDMLFATMNVDYPAITTFTFAIMRALPFILGLSLFLGGVLLLYYHLRFKHLKASEQFATLSLIPGLKRWMTLSITYTFSLQMSQLLKGGLHAHDALRVFITQKQMPFLTEEGERLHQKLSEGHSLVEAIQDASHYERALAEIVRNGQASGNLVNDLSHYSEMIWEDLNERATRTTMLIQPLLFIVIGGFMLLLFLSVFIPIFELISSLDT